MPESPERTALYRLYDEGDQLVYIGIASNPIFRWQQHSRTSPWWPNVAKLTLEWLETRECALEAEEGAIKRERPLHNHIHNGPEVSILPRVVDPAMAQRMLKARLARHPHLKYDLQEPH